MTKLIRKAVFPVAGLGTRFLPATKATPKEMLPVVDKPLIQYGVEEAIEAGIEEMIFVTGRTKNAIMDHFDTSYELEKELEEREKTTLLEMVRDIVPSHVSCVFIRQAVPLGLGHAVLCAKPIVGNEAFAVLLADDLINHSKGCLAQMVDVYSQQNCSIIGTETIDPFETDSYGIVAGDGDNKLMKIHGIVEKPAPADAPSNQAVVGRYILTSSIFRHLEQTGRGAGNEIQLTDGIARLMSEETIYSYAFDGTRYDCGSKLGYLQANVDYALQHPELANDFNAWLKTRFC